jgi:hypothetical protein
LPYCEPRRLNFDCCAFPAVVGNYGFYAIFFFWAACTMFYFFTAAFFLPETKGKTLEELEVLFEGSHCEIPA